MSMYFRPSSSESFLTELFFLVLIVIVTGYAGGQLFDWINARLLTVEAAGFKRGASHVYTENLVNDLKDDIEYLDDKVSELKKRARRDESDTEIIQ